MPANRTGFRFKLPSIAQRDALLQTHTGLVHILARRLHARFTDEAKLDDLIGAGLFGLMRAAIGFDAGRGLAFTTYATPFVRGAMLDELRRLDLVPDSVHPRSPATNQARHSISRPLGCSPDASAMAQPRGVTLETYWKHGSTTSAAAAAARWPSTPQFPAAGTCEARSPNSYPCTMSIRSSSSTSTLSAIALFRTGSYRH